MKVVWIAALGLIVACVSLWAPAATANDETLEAKLRATSIEEYRLGPNDRVRVTVFGEEDLSGEFQVDTTGFVALPLIGEVKGGGLTLREFETAVEDQYADGYLIRPRVSIEVVNYRPFFIVGEVVQVGQYPFEPGMTVLKAVSTAGGYTPRANQRRVFVLRREISEEEIAVSTKSDIRVMPGDVIRVPERLF